MSEPRPTHSPSGAKLLNESKANPASVNMDIFAKKSARNGAATGQGTVNSNYLRETREQNPDPAQDQKEKPQVSLSNCKFATPVADLKLNEEFEFSVEVKKIGQPKSLQATFDLYATRKREGKEQRDKIWSGKEGKPVDAKAEPVVLKGKDVLATQADYVLGELVTFELEAIHSEAEQSAKSEKVEVSLKTVAHWLGGDDLFFRNDGEFPLLGAEGSLIGVLVAAVERFKKPGQDGETAICFGFASSAGEADANRSLSLRRAKVVKSLLDRDEAAWVELAKANFETVDIQQFLSDLHTACGWECDPGEVNGQAGPKTKAAIESFQTECNTRYSLGLKHDGVCGPKTWAAVHRAILGQVQAAMDEDATKAPAWPKPKWGNKGKGVHANGEDFATGGDKPEERSVQITFFAPGSEPPLKEVSAGQKASPEHNPVQQPDRVEKVKVEKGAGAKKSAPKQTDEDPWVFYAPGRDQYLVVSDPAEKDSLLADINKWAAVQDKVRVFRENVAKTGITEAKLKEGEKLKEEVEKGLKNLGKDPSNAIQELLLWKGNKRVHTPINARTYIGPDKIQDATSKGRWKKNDDAEVKKILDEWLKEGDSEPKSKTEKTAKLKAVLWESDSVDKQWPWSYKFSKKKEAQTKAGTFSGSAEAQFFRFVAGADASAEFDLGEKKLQIGAKGACSYSLAEGKADGSWIIPNDKGFDLFKLLILSPKAREAIQPNTECLFRYTVKVEGKAFVGVSIAGSIMLPAIELKDEQKAMVGASASGFAGASAEGKVSGAIEWSSGKAQKFEILTSVAGVASGNVGVGAEAKIEFSYTNGKVHFVAGAMATWGLGGKLGLEYELGVNQAVDLFGHLFEAVEWRRVDAVTLAAFEFYLNATFAPIVLGVRAIEKPVVATATQFGNWLEKKAASAASFANLKATTYVGTANPQLLRVAPPETLGRVLQVLMEGFQPEDFTAILNVLKVTQSAHELKWTLRNAQRGIDPNSEANKEKALKAGIQRLRSHGANAKDHDDYIRKLDGVLRSKGVL